MKKEHNPNGASRNLWGSARERARLKARFTIRERIHSSTTTRKNGLGASYEDNDDDYCTPGATAKVSSVQSTVDPVVPSSSNCQFIRNALQRVLANDQSFFSLIHLAEYAHVYSTPFDTCILYEDSGLLVGQDRLLSWYGLSGVEQTRGWLSRLRTFTILDFSILFKRYGIVGSLLMGGVNPCTQGVLRSEYTAADSIDEWQQLSLDLGIRALRSFFEPKPLPLQVYILKRVAEFRRETWITASEQDGTSRCHLCQKLTPESYQLSMDGSCHHVICGPCFWEELLESLPETEGDVVPCFVCESAQQSALNEKKNSKPSENKRGEDAEDSPGNRFLLSRQRFFHLPIDSMELRRTAGKKKRKPGKQREMASTWSQAVSVSLGNSQDVRRDKYFGFVERGAIHFVRGCLEAGIDLRAQNDYGQTGLYIASWRGYKRIVRLLLEYGSNPNITANDGTTPAHAAKQNGHFEVVDLLNAFAGSLQGESAVTEMIASDDATAVKNLCVQLSTLIPTSSEHVGAGSYTIDDTLTDKEVQLLYKLWNRLPTENSSEKKKSSSLCSVRSYYCDVDGCISRIIRRAVKLCGEESLACRAEELLVFPFMRFLSYNHAGTSLAPHVDLFRLDQSSGVRSTHSFLLYLADCLNGGETTLLRDLKGSGEENVIVRVKPETGRLLLFPHNCPHEGEAVADIPKLLIRGEVTLF